MALAERNQARAAAFVDLPTEWRHSAGGLTYAAAPERARCCAQRSRSSYLRCTSRRQSTASDAIGMRMETAGLDAGAGTRGAHLRGAVSALGFSHRRKRLMM